MTEKDGEKRISMTDIWVKDGGYDEWTGHSTNKKTRILERITETTESCSSVIGG